MATLTKQYRIEIQLDNAQQQLTETSAKLAALDESLQGLGRNSDAAKAIVAEMAKLSKQLSGAENEVDSLNTALDNIKPGTLPALEAEIEELEAAMRLAAVGTAEFDAALLKLGNARGELRKLEDQLDIISDTKQHAAAFVDFSNGVVGAFSVATAAAQTFGLSADATAEYEQKLQSLLVVMSAFEAISKAGNAETLGVIKSTYAAAKAYLFAGESASASAKVTRAALVSTGIGAIIVLVGLLVANWDRLTSSVKGSEKFFTKVKAIASGVLDSAIASVKNFAGVIEKVFDGDFSGAIAKAKNVGKEVGVAYAKGYEESIFESHRKELEAQVAAAARQIEVLKAKGRDTFKEEENNLLAKLRLQKQGTDEEKAQYLDLQKDLAILRAANAKKEKEEALANTLARIGNVVALEQAKGQESYRAELSQKRQELAGLLSAETQNQAAITAKRGEIAALKAQHEQEQAAKSRARLVEAQQSEVALLEKQGKDTLALRVENARALLALDTGTNEQALAQKRVDKQALLLLEEEANQREKTIREDFRQQRVEEEANAREADQVFIKAAGEAATNAYLEGVNKAAKKDVGGNLLIRLFGLTDAQAQDLKGRLADFASVAGNLVAGLLGTAQAAAEEQLSQAQAQLQTVTEQLGQAQSAADATASQLETASGARRDYLLRKLQAERAEVDRLAAQKAKAAKAEEDAEKRKAELAKQSAALSAAASLASTVATGTEAVRAAVGVIAGSSSLPFPANLFAIATGLATVTTAVLQAKQLAKSFAVGGYVEGPRHSQGGIQLYHQSGAHLGEMEGGEFIFSRAAVAKHGVGFLQMLNDSTSTYVKPSPTGRFATGGQLSTGSGVPAGSVVIPQADLTELLSTNRAMLGHMQQVAAATTTTASYGPARLQIGPGEAVGIEAERQKAEQALIDATL